MIDINKSDKNHIYLLSYPRSGSHWFRYCFTQITQRQIYMGWRHPIAKETERNYEKELERQTTTYPIFDLEQFMKSEYTFRKFRLGFRHDDDPVQIFSQQLSAYLDHLTPGQSVRFVPPHRGGQFLTPGHLAKDQNILWGWPDRYLASAAAQIVFEFDHTLIEQYIRQHSAYVQLDTDRVLSTYCYGLTQRAHRDDHGVKYEVPSCFTLNNLFQHSHNTEDDTKIRLLWATEDYWADELLGLFKPLSNYHYGEELVKDGQLCRTNRVPPHVNDFDIKLICIVRDYKESTTSQFKHLKHGVANPAEEIKKYMSVIEAYDKFPYKKKILYYEDLIMDPAKALSENIVNFTGTDLGLSKEDMSENLKMLDDYVFKNHKELQKKYLQRY